MPPSWKTVYYTIDFIGAALFLERTGFLHVCTHDNPTLHCIIMVLRLRSSFILPKVSPKVGQHKYAPDFSSSTIADICKSTCVYSANWVFNQVRSSISDAELMWVKHTVAGRSITTWETIIIPSIDMSQISEISSLHFIYLLML